MIVMNFIKRTLNFALRTFTSTIKPIRIKNNKARIGGLEKAGNITEYFRIGDRYHLFCDEKVAEQIHF